jgi:hypothetical protein
VRLPAILVLCLLCLPALATTTTPPATDPSATANSDADAIAAAVAAAVAKAFAEAAATAESDAASDSDAAAEANGVQQLTIESERQAPAVFAPSVYPTAPCVAGWSFGGSGAGAGLSLGRGKELAGCVERELIRIAAQMGLASQAEFMWCNQAAVLAAFGTVDACLDYRSPRQLAASELRECEATVRQQTESLGRRDDLLAECARK